MLFAHDTATALQAAAALVNSAPREAGAEDLLPDPAALTEYLDTWEMTGRRAGDVAELAEVLVLRAQLSEVWDAAVDNVVAVVNRLLRDGHALPQLTRHDHWDYHVHATEPDAPVAQRLAVETSLAVADLVRAGELRRLARCEATGCGLALVDLTKNRARRFCDTACANRTHAAAYRARKASR